MQKVKRDKSQNVKKSKVKGAKVKRAKNQMRKVKTDKIQNVKSQNGYKSRCKKSKVKCQTRQRDKSQMAKKSKRQMSNGKKSYRIIVEVPNGHQRSKRASDSPLIFLTLIRLFMLRNSQQILLWLFLRFLLLKLLLRCVKS